MPKIVEKEAKVVRLIYKLFLSGKTPHGIANILTKDNIPTPSGKKNWQPNTVKSILTNEKMCGNALLQKSFVADFLTKKIKVNEGEVTQYFIENSHEAIIPLETFELVQEEFRRRKAAGPYTSAINCFASRIVCGDCGGFYGRKVWHSNTSYAQTVWQCNNKFKKRKFCTTPHLKESLLKKAFTEAFNSIIENKEEILEYYGAMITTLTSTKEKEAECETIDKQCLQLEEVVEQLIDENARCIIDQEEYLKRYADYVARHNGLQKKRQALVSEIALLKAKRNLMNAFIQELEPKNELLSEFDEELWCNTLCAVIVKSAEEVVFQFKDGRELPWRVE